MSAAAAASPETHARRPAPATPLLLSLMRIPLLAAAFVAVTAVLRGTGVAPDWAAGWQIAADHGYVVLNLAVDLPCLLILAAVLRRDGRRLRDLLGPGGVPWPRLAVRGLGVFALMAAMFGVFPLLAGGLTGAVPYPAGMTHPPVWVTVWTVVVFPLITAPTEELLFRGYALPELHAARRPGARAAVPVLAVAVTAVGFGVAHTFIPPLGGLPSLVARALTLTAIGVVLDLVRLRSRHLAPLIIGHYLVDAGLIGGFAVLAATS